MDSPTHKLLQSPTCKRRMSENRYRLVVLGSGKVGKTSLIRHYLYGEFPEKYKETVEDLHSREFRIHGASLPLDILDTNFNFPDMRRLAISSANAFLLVFAVDDVVSFRDMSDLWNEICDRRHDIDQLPTVVLGNKSDMKTKKIFPETAEAWISRLHKNSRVRYVEGSAKTGDNIPTLFRNLLELSGFLKTLEDSTSESQEEHSKTNRLGVGNTADMPLRRNRSMRARSREPEPEGGKVKRHGSMRIKGNRDKDSVSPMVNRKGDEMKEMKPMARHGSLIKRTKHLSLRMKQPQEKHDVDEADCRIS